jgi:hypothetical protein
MKLCECGCGEPAPISKKNCASRGMVKGQPMRFINHHWGYTIYQGGPVAEHRRRRERARANGLCARCQKRLSSTYHCKVCQEKDYRILKAMRERRTLAGLCSKCARPVHLDRTMCLHHLAQMRRLTKKTANPLPNIVRFITKEEHQCLLTAKQQLKQLNRYLLTKQRPTVSPLASEA